MAAADLGAAEWERSKVTNQDVNLLKRLGLMKKEDAIRFPNGLHHLTPNSILHISIFITLCEAFLGVSPNWALWKRIFFCRRNGSPNVAYNIGGVVISVRSSVNYFDVKLPDSVQGWRKRWLYIREENHGCAEDNIPPFDGAEKILRRRSWDAEATEEERTSTEALMTRIHELQNTRGKELSGIQIIVYFLKNRVQPLQARKFPLWKYTGDEDVDRLSVDLEVKDLEKLVRKITSLSKKDSIPSSCRVKPFSAAHALPKNHPNLVSLPPLPEGGEVEERTVISNDNQEASSFVNEPADSRKSAGSAEKDAASEDTTSAQSPPPADSPKNKRKRGDVEDSGTSKPEEAAPLPQKAAYMTHILRVSSPVIKDLLRIGAQFVGYREYANKAEEKLAEANERANTLALQLEQSEKARKKAELDAVDARAEADKAKADAAGVEDLRKRLHTAETSLSDHIAAQSAREEAIRKRLTTQSRRFVELKELRVQLQSVKKQSLILMEQSRESSQREKIAFQQAQDAIAEKDAAVAEAAAATSRENSMLQLLTDASLDMADVGQIVPKCLEKMSKRKRNFGKYDDIVTPVAEDMMDELLRMDSEFFVKGSYAELC
ncbi:hypothetical protein QYE76_062362 [Lolium multiflorum]|uniref:Transposase (putative) gypsy type domain-containing protein n=1 Tax=Lolium multiflorum TaxID=4521 RepID=A0AAD8S328_LOLMU|nr:hypothetical protein QYE76_062362 [Lolium multiflorum]